MASLNFVINVIREKPPVLFIQVVKRATVLASTAAFVWNEAIHEVFASVSGLASVLEYFHTSRSRRRVSVTAIVGLPFGVGF